MYLRFKLLLNVAIIYQKRIVDSVLMDNNIFGSTKISKSVIKW